MTSSTPSTDTTADDATWTVEHFRRFWAAPDPAAPGPHLSEEIVGRWPDGRVLKGTEAYLGRLVNIGKLIPDIRLEVLEHAVNGDIAFIRWHADGTGRNDRFDLVGVDRVRVRGDQLVENVICFDTAAFEAQAGVPLSSI
jgi:SnoaL-like domain